MLKKEEEIIIREEKLDNIFKDLMNKKEQMDKITKNIAYEIGNYRVNEEKLKRENNDNKVIITELNNQINEERIKNSNLLNKFNTIDCEEINK